MLKRLALCITCAMPWFPTAAAPFKLAVYGKSMGAVSVQKALQDEPELELTLIKTLDFDSISAHDAVLIGSCSLDRPETVQALQVYAGIGGGIAFNHSSCGRGKPETLFPSVVPKVSGRREDTVLVVKDPSHPVAAGLPAQFEHAYYDHLLLDVGAAGQVVLADREGGAVTVVGAVGYGRVAFNGAIPGYWYDAATYWQGERPPEGSERTLIANIARWVSAGRFTALADDVVAQRREEVESKLRLARLENLLPTADWFGEEMLRGAYLPQRPVSELGGRFFITYDTQSWRGYDLRSVDSPEQLAFFRQRLRLDAQRLKWLGVTDIMYWTDASGERVYHPTEVPDMKVQVRGVDPLAELIQAATAEGVRVWAAWHSCFRDANVAEKYGAKDQDGNLYRYGRRNYCEDLLGSAWRERCFRMLDEYAEKYKPLGNFEGLACYDELWFCYADFHGDDMDAFGAFCLERFGDKPPADMTTRLAQGRGYNDTADVWRNRYILFKQSVMTSFWRDLIHHAHKRGLQIGLQLRGTAAYASGWCWGMDSVALAGLGADFFNTTCGEEAHCAWPNTYRWAHCYAPWGFYNTHCLRGGPGGFYFTFNQLWRLIMYGNNPALPRELARHIHNQRQWANCESLARIAVLHNQNTLQMLYPDPRPYQLRERAIRDAVQCRQDADMVFTRATELHQRFRVLIAPPHAVTGISAEVYGELRDFVSDGGVIVSCNAPWVVSRADLTQPRDVTAEMVGVTYGEPEAGKVEAVSHGDFKFMLDEETARRQTSVGAGTRTVAAFAGGRPAVTERPLGQGVVIGVHFDLGAALQKADNPALRQWLWSLLRERSQPAVYAEGDDFRIVSVLRKGNWIAVALYPEKTPAKVRLQVDLKALGLTKPNYRMLMLGKRMEIAPPGDLWGESGFWAAAELAAGFPVTIVADNDSFMPLPETFALSDFENDGKGRAAQRMERHREYLETVTRGWWDSDSRGKRKRDYAHEIVVLAPGDEYTMP